MTREPDAVTLLIDQFSDGHPAADELIGLRSACSKLQAERKELRAEIERLLADLESGMERFYSQMAELGNAKAEVDRLRAERDGLRELLNNKDYISCKADYERGHLSHCNYLEATERKALGTALEPKP
jgi:predicted nuclease with TOPRIM domain